MQQFGERLGQIVDQYLAVRQNQKLAHLVFAGGRIRALPFFSPSPPQRRRGSG